MASLPVEHFLGHERVGQATTGFRAALTAYAAGPEPEDWHAHRFPSLSLVLGGSYQEELAGRPYRRQVGAVKCIAAGEVHRCHGYAPGTQQLNLLLQPAFWIATGLPEARLHGELAAAPSRLALLRIGRELLHPDTSPASLELLTYALFASPDFRPVPPTPPAWVSRLRELLHAPGEAAHTLPELAQLLGVHPVTISRTFPRYFAVTLSCYQRRLKVERAFGLLRTTARSLTDIAYACGFADQSHFTHAFQQATGFLPKELRRV